VYYTKFIGLDMNVSDKVRYYYSVYIKILLRFNCRSSNTPEIASVTLVNSTDGECAFSAVVSVVSKSPHRKQAIIMTENKGMSFQQ